MRRCVCARREACSRAQQSARSGGAAALLTLGCDRDGLTLPSSFLLGRGGSISSDGDGSGVVYYHNITAGTIGIAISISVSISISVAISIGAGCCALLGPSKPALLGCSTAVRGLGGSCCGLLGRCRCCCRGRRGRGSSLRRARRAAIAGAAAGAVAGAIAGGVAGGIPPGSCSLALEVLQLPLDLLQLLLRLLLSRLVLLHQYVQLALERLDALRLALGLGVGGHRLADSRHCALGLRPHRLQLRQVSRLDALHLAARLDGSLLQGQHLLAGSRHLLLQRRLTGLGLCGQGLLGSLCLLQLLPNRLRLGLSGL
mmetsp:Transcript_16757/g.36251  ORF Transcript_16757/g.36251 Transcript_16757/m.36251 type:complete len:314 (-) Transcript_16757:2371-3312(-)